MGILFSRRFKNTVTQNITYSSFFIALGLLLPQVFHGVSDLAKVISPMHIPVLICAFFLDWPFALATGVLTPALSTLFFSMPPFPSMFFVMVFELGAYALTANLVYTKALGLFREKLRSGIAGVYISLAVALIAGRVTGAAAAAVSFAAFGLGGYTGFFAYLLGLFTGGAAAIIIQLLLIPPVIQMLKKRVVIKEAEEASGAKSARPQTTAGEKEAESERYAKH